jgi:putative PIN family toxin of toxin-antitoxin system
MEPAHRFVVDTNVLLSYILWPGGAIKQTVEHVVSHGVLLFSDNTLLELFEVVQRPKFDRHASRQKRRQAVADIAAMAIRIDPAAIAPLCRDPKDDMLLALAIAGEADFLITGDRDLLDLGAIGGARILSPADFVVLLA